MKEILDWIENADAWWLDCPSKGGFDTERIRKVINFEAIKIDNYDQAYLQTMYGATSTEYPEGSDELEPYERWLERQLVSRIHKLNTIKRGNFIWDKTNGVIKFIEDPEGEYEVIIK